MNHATPDGFRRASRSLRSTPSIRFEKEAWRAGFDVVAGVDEVGRGAWAGPLVAAAVVLPRAPSVRGRLTRLLNRQGLRPTDSKLMTHDSRFRIALAIGELGLPVAIHEVAPQTVDEVGLGAANRMALCAAVETLRCADYALIDAFRLDDLCCDGKSIIRGDSRCLSIALASIVAKVHRDEIMCRLDGNYPGYGFAQHKGYGTRVHAEALERLGVTDQHRRSFKPVADRLVGV